MNKSELIGGPLDGLEVNVDECAQNQIGFIRQGWNCLISHVYEREPDTGVWVFKETIKEGVEA